MSELVDKTEGLDQGHTVENLSQLLEETTVDDSNKPRVVELADDESEYASPRSSSPTDKVQTTVLTGAGSETGKSDSDPSEHGREQDKGADFDHQDDDQDEDFDDAKDFYDFPKSIELAKEAKEEGNKHYLNKEYDESLEYYSKAITYCPETEECKESLATFHGNRAAAYYALEEYELVVEDCNAALEMKEDYVKVLARRMQALEKLEKYEEALTDAKKLQERDPSFPKIGETIMRLQRLYEEKMNKMKDEALGKLKELGNSILGNFGMSLDNFKMAQDPSTGSWNLSMNR